MTAMRPAVVLLVGLAIPALAAEDARMEAVGLRFVVPRGWERVQPTSPMRGAQFRIPRAGRRQEDGELILFRFEERKGGISDFVTRWYEQFKQPDGRPSKEVASVTRRNVNGLSVQMIDLAGTYRAPMGPMEHPEKPGWRLLGAVVEGEGGPWYWRAVGPAATMEKAKPGFDALIGSLEVRR
jgi:hypothetical protein